MKKVMINACRSGSPVMVEACCKNGFPGFKLLGLHGKYVKEIETRVKMAMHHSGFKFPQTSVVVSVTPSTTTPHPEWYDLPIALAVLFVNNMKGDGEVEVKARGELSLFGDIIPNSDEYLEVNGNILKVNDLTEAFMAISEALYK